MNAADITPESHELARTTTKSILCALYGEEIGNAVYLDFTNQATESNATMCPTVTRSAVSRIATKLRRGFGLPARCPSKARAGAPPANEWQGRTYWLSRQKTLSRTPSGPDDKPLLRTEKWGEKKTYFDASPIYSKGELIPGISFACRPGRFFRATPGAERYFLVGKRWFFVADDGTFHTTKKRDVMRSIRVRGFDRPEAEFARLQEATHAVEIRLSRIRCDAPSIE